MISLLSLSLQTVRDLTAGRQADVVAKTLHPQDRGPRTDETPRDLTAEEATGRCCQNLASAGSALRALTETPRGLAAGK